MEVKKQKGFTIIEIIVVVGILGIVAAIGTNIFFTVIRSSTKSKNINTVKQNGDHALSTMERMIRNSYAIITNSDAQICENGMTKIKIINSNKEETEFELVDSDGDPSNGYNYLASNSARLTSDEVRVASGSFDCLSSGDFNPKTVTINFTLTQNFSPTPRVEEEATIDFRAVIETRNY